MENNKPSPELTRQPKSTVEYDRYGGLIAAISETNKEMQLLLAVKPWVTDELAFAERQRRLTAWLNYYITELNKTGHGPEEQGKVGTVPA